MKKLSIIVISTLACAALIFASIREQSKACSAADQSQVIIVGAGMAGMTGAVTLAKNGIDVIVLEKGNYVGGRIASRYFEGIECNVGAQWLFRNINPLINYYMGILPLQPIENEGVLWKGKLYMKDEFENDTAATKGPAADLALAYEKLYVDWILAGIGKEWFFDIEPQNDLWNTFENMNCSEYLSDFSEDVYEYFNAELGGETGGDISDLSAIVLVGWEGDPDSNKYIVKGGNQVLIRKMAEDVHRVGGRVYLNSEVTSVEQIGNAIKVECSDGRVFISDYVIVATPANVTKMIVSNLPADKEAALVAVSYTRVAELLLSVKNFPNSEEVGCVLTVEECINGFLNQTGTVAGNPKVGTIIAACVNPKILNLDDNVIVEDVAKVLEKVAPGFNPESDILNFSMKRWGEGIFQCAPGFFSEYQTTLRKNVGRIFFAGDYTGDPDLTAAAWSGSRAAKAIRDALPPVMSIEPGKLQAGAGFNYTITLQKDINIPFDLYVIADTQYGPYSLYFDGRVKKGIKPLYRNIRSFKAPFQKKVTPDVILPAAMDGREVTFYAVAVQAGRVCNVRSLSSLNNDTLYVIWLSRESVTVN